MANEKHDAASLIPGSPEWLIEQARNLERDRAAVLAQIESNRHLLRSLYKVKALTMEQEAFVDTFYPTRKRGESRTPEQTEATRTLRESVRQAA